MRKWFVLSALVVLAVAVSLPAVATVPLTSTGSFTGDYSETWESFDNYYIDPYYFRANPTTILNGTANISNGVMTVYQTGFQVGLGGFGLAYYGLAPVSDGIKGMGLDASNQLATINSTKSWDSFGAYWGASKVNSSSADPSITVYAYDALNNLIGTDSFTYAGGGALAWHGWSFNKAVTKIEYTGNYVVIDGLQANEYKQTSAVPEPATLLGFGLPMLMVGLGKLKSLRK